uniref:NB-ARC domain-containing protein n=1 Tax=Oryza punctata TaxID=4537 RepID=A0A0E0MEK1_ORYPU
MKVVDKIQEIIKNQIHLVKAIELQPYLKVNPMKPEEDDDNMEGKISKGNSLGVLLALLVRSSAADETKEKVMSILPETEFYDHIIKTAAKKLKYQTEQVQVKQEGGANQQILLEPVRYEHILQEVFSKNSMRQQAQEQDTKQAATSAVTLAEDQIKEIIDKVKQEALREVSKTFLQQDQVNEDKCNKEQPTSVPAGGQGPTAEALTEETKEKGQQATGSNPTQDQIPQATVEQKTIEILDSIKETIEKMRYIRRKIERQLVMAGIVDEIQKHLGSVKKTLIILKIDHKYVREWEKTRNALSLLPKKAAVMIIMKTKGIQNIQIRAKEYCYPIEEPIDYSLVALYHEIVLEITSQQKNEDNYDPWIFSTILDKCEPHEFCWKIFTHTLYVKPRRSKEELHKLHNSLQAVPTKSLRSIAMKMFKFSYRDMPKEYQSCLLYLAIFPPGYKIRRSTLIGRWVAEGLITTDDWHWSSSVQKAEQCFEELIARWFVYSTDISAPGRVKSCTVGDLVHDFITEIAKKQRIVETRLSYHLARYFSIFNDLHLRGSDKIDDFFKRLSESSQWSRLKVLDLEGCQCFEKNRRYLRNICNKIMLLKYLSLRGTDVNWLPSEINNLRELEVLDIRQTKVPATAIEDIILLKLKRLLVGHTNPSPSSTTDTGTPFPSHVLVPEKIEKNAKKSKDLKDIGRLWQLRIEDKLSSDTMHTWRRSSPSVGMGSRNSVESSNGTEIGFEDKAAPEVEKIVLSTNIESITFAGAKQFPKLEELELNNTSYITATAVHGPDSEASFAPAATSATNLSPSTPTIAAATAAASTDLPLSTPTDPAPVAAAATDYAPSTSTTANNNDMFSEFLGNAKQIAKLLDESCDVSQLAFNKEKVLIKLNVLVVNCARITEIIFNSGACPKLEKVVWTFTEMKSFSGIDNLPRLKELEFNGESIPNHVKEAIGKHRNKTHCTEYKREIQEKTQGNTEEKLHGAPCCPFIRKDKR